MYLRTTNKSFALLCPGRGIRASFTSEKSRGCLMLPRQLGIGDPEPWGFLVILLRGRSSCQNAFDLILSAGLARNPRDKRNARGHSSSRRRGSLVSAPSCRRPPAHVVSITQPGAFRPRRSPEAPRVLRLLCLGGTQPSPGGRPWRWL